MTKSLVGRIVFMTIVFGLLLALMTVVNYRFAAANPGGNDFVPRYVGARLLLTDGIDPYSDQATLEIQNFLYGRPAEAGEDKNLFVYPLYSVLVFAPFSLIDNYTLARATWMTLLEAALAATVLIGLRLGEWRPHWSLVLALTTFGLLWYHSARPLINGNAAILCGFFVAATMLAIRGERDVLAGPLAVMATIKPQVVVLWLPWVVLWAISRRRWRLIGSSVLCLAILVVGASLIVPGWLQSNYRQVAVYPTYTLPGTPGEIFDEWWPGAGRWIGLAITVVAAALLIIQWRSAWAASFGRFLWVAYLTITITMVIGIRTATENYVVLLPALILVLGALAQRYPRAGRGLIWLLLGAFLVGLWALFLTTLVGNRQHELMFFPTPLFLLAAMLLLEPVDDEARALPAEVLSEPL